MSKKVMFHEKAKGRILENEDWWHLVVEDSGEKYVVHSWEHLDGNSLKIHEGEERLELEDVLAGGLGPKLKVALENL